MYVHCLPVSLLLLVSVGIESRGQELDKLIDRLGAIRSQLDSSLSSGYALGTIRNESTLGTEVSVSEQDIQVFYDEPKFRLDITDAADPGEARLAMDNQIVLFDGASLYQIQIGSDEDRRPTHSGNIYFEFRLQSLLGKAGYPFRPPLHLWSDLLHPEKIDPDKLEVQNLAGGGMVLSENHGGYSNRFYFFDDFDFDLRRVTFTAKDAAQPFREITLYWEKTQSVRFIRRYAVKGSSSSSSGTRKSKREIEFLDLKPNVSIDPAILTLEGLNLPAGTQFSDHRTNVNGKPQKLIWDGQQLVPVSSAPK